MKRRARVARHRGTWGQCASSVTGAKVGGTARDGANTVAWNGVSACCGLADEGIRTGSVRYSTSQTCQREGSRVLCAFPWLT
jgi:hypothetical protein